MRPVPAYVIVDLDQTERHAEIGLTLAPPSNPDNARITARQAYDICRTAGLCPYVDAGPAIYLALATRTLRGHDRRRAAHLSRRGAVGA